MQKTDRPQLIYKVLGPPIAISDYANRHALKGVEAENITALVQHFDVQVPATAARYTQRIAVVDHFKSHFAWTVTMFASVLEIIGVTRKVKISREDRKKGLRSIACGRLAPRALCTFPEQLSQGIPKAWLQRTS